jgi:hypothetical protein
MYNKQYTTSCKRISRETYAFLLFVLLSGVFLGWNESKGWEGYMGSYYKLLVWRVARSFIRLYMSSKHDSKSEFGYLAAELVTGVIIDLD